MMRKVALFLLAALLFPVAAVGADAERALRERAKNLYDVGDYRMALNLYERILERNPKDGAALDLSGWCLRYLGDRKSAEERFENALTWLSGEDAVWVLIGLGELYLDGNLYDKAQTRLEEALKVAPSNAEAVERAARGLTAARKNLEKAASTPATMTTALDNADDRKLQAFRPQIDQVDWTSPEETPKEAPEETPKEASKEAPKKTPKETSKEAPKETPKETPKEKPKEKPREKPKKPEKPARREVVYGVSLGVDIETALADLERAGHPLADEPFTKAGKVYYLLRGLPARPPRSLNSEATRFYITAYNGAVLSVIIQTSYGKERSFDEVKELLRETLAEIGERDARGLKITENIFSYEMSLALSNSHGLWLSAVDKANGSSLVEIEHIDLVNVSHYWMAGGR
ncbi:MAG: hypothetical protein LBD04_02905 [Synergistaceae bacterium]|jgi:tetratricopeptide (TPR) repeat protein|nr:hypothetical protein [Synergistaceae bacterium]